jgi:polysaccharide chain length determinant protein (PEP-CTERM system associated)
MASLRVRTPAEYLRLLWRRRYFVFVPLVIVSAALSYGISKLPNVYESTTVIIVDPPKVSPTYVQPVNQIDLNSRLSTIQKQVTSRTELQRIINRFGLYQEMTSRGTPIELVIDEMLRHIYVRPFSASSGIYAFSISYRGSDPRTIRDVTAELAARFIDANSDETRRQVYTTIDQLEGRINEVKAELEKIESARAGFLIRNPDAVGGQEQNMLGQMNSLSMIRQSQQSSIDALRSQIATNEQLLATLKTQENVEPDTPLAVGQAEGQLRSRRAEVEAQLRQLQTVYTEKNPEVIKMRVQIETINRELEDLRTRTEQEKVVKRASRGNDVQIKNLDIRIAADKRDLARKEAELEQTNQQFGELQNRLRGTPLLATEATKIERDYNTLRRRYEDLLSMRDNARFSAKVINDFSGETFRMSDPASLPEVPVSPKRNLLYPLSLAAGLLAGLIAAIAREVRALLTIRDARDVAHYVRLPLLVTVPRIVTEKERRWRPLINTAKIFGVILLIVAAVPLLYQVIKVSRVLNLIAGN